MSSDHQAQDHRQNRRTSIRAAAVAGAVVAAIAVWLIARYGAGVRLRMPAFSAAQGPAGLGLGFVAVTSAVASLIGWGAVTLIERLSHHPRRNWLITGLLALVVSLSAPLSGHGVTAADRAALICMHLATAAVLIPVFARTAGPGRRRAGGRASRPSTESRPAGTGGAR